MFRLKRGQLTIFVIVGIIVVLVVGAFFVFKGERENSGSVLLSDSDFGSYMEGVVDCFENVYMDSVDLIGFQGGYYDFSSGARYGDVEIADIFSNETYVFQVPYYFYLGEDSVVLKEKVGFEIARAVDENIDFCFNEIDPSGITVDYDSPTTEVKVNDGEILLVTDLMITLSNGERSVVVNMDEYSVLLNSQLSDMLEISNYYVEESARDVSLFCFSCLENLAKEKNLIVEIIDYEEEESDFYDGLFVITSNESDVYPYEFQFLSKYSYEAVNQQMEETLSNEEK